MSLFKFGFTSDSGKGGEDGNEKKRRGSEETKKAYEAKRQRVFLPKWASEYSWLRFDENINAMFCKSCEKFATDSNSFCTGCTTFRIESIKSHDKSVGHMLACRKDTIAQKRKLKEVEICTI